MLPGPLTISVLPDPAGSRKMLVLRGGVPNGDEKRPREETLDDEDAYVAAGCVSGACPRRAIGTMAQRQVSAPFTFTRRQFSYMAGLGTSGVHCAPRRGDWAKVEDERSRKLKLAIAESEDARMKIHLILEEAFGLGRESALPAGWINPRLRLSRKSTFSNTPKGLSRTAKSVAGAAPLMR